MIKLKYPGCFFLQYFYHEYMCIKKNCIVLFLFFIFSLYFSNSIFAFDFTQPKELFSNIGSKNISFNSTYDIVSDSQNNIYILTGGDGILKYNSSTNNWSQIVSIPGLGSEIGQLNTAQGITIDNQDNIYVADTNNNRIQKYNIGTSSWSVVVSAPTDHKPWDLVLDSFGDIYAHVKDNFNISWLYKYTFNNASWTKIVHTGNITKINIDFNNNIYFTDSTNNQFRKYNIGSSVWTSTGVAGTSTGQLSQPLAIAISSNNYLYISDTQGGKRLQKLNIGSGQWSVIANPTYSGEDVRIDQIFIDNQGNLLIKNTTGYQSFIRKYNPTTNTWTYLGASGNIPGEFTYLKDIQGDQDGNLYVADTNNNRIQIYNIGTTTWTSLGSYGTSTGQFKRPSGIALDKNGNIYVADTENSRIQKYDTDGHWSVLLSSGSVNKPVGLEINDNNELFIANKGSYNIKIYDIDENSLSVMPGTESDNFTTEYLALDDNDNVYFINLITGSPVFWKYDSVTKTASTLEVGSSHSGGNFGYLTGIDCDKKGNIYVVDRNNSQIGKYDFSSETWSIIGSSGVGDTQFSSPTQIYVDKNSNIYVADTNNHRIQKLWYYDLAQYFASDNGSVTGPTTQKLSEEQVGTTVTAIPEDGYRFLTWSDGIKDNPRVDVGGSGAISAVARFGQPQKEITTLSPSVLADEVTSYHISIASTNPAATPNFTFNTNYTFKAGDAEIVFPADTVVTSTEGGDLDLTQFATTENTNTVKATLTQALAAVQVGIPNEKLTFSKAVTITIPVGASYNGQTLEIKYKREGEDTWNVEGTCVVASGNCTFQTTHATTFAALEPVTSSSNDSNSSNSTPVSVSSTPDHSCHSSKPLFTSDLFQINTTTNSAKIYFTPQADTNNYVISFSTNPNAEEHGEQVKLLSEGVQSHSIYYLKPNTTYYVKVRGQNGCMPGEWSNIMKFKTNSTIYYKSGLTTFVSNVKSLVKNTVTKKTDTTKTDDLKEDKTNISTDINSNQTNNKTTETTSSPNQQRTEASKAKKCFLWWCW